MVSLLKLWLFLSIRCEFPCMSRKYILKRSTLNQFYVSAQRLCCLICQYNLTYDIAYLFALVHLIFHNSYIRKILPESEAGL